LEERLSSFFCVLFFVVIFGRFGLISLSALLWNHHPDNFGITIRIPVESSSALPDIYHPLWRGIYTEEELPAIRTISNILNRQEYRLRTVAKTKVQKKRRKQTQSSKMYGK
jgi:hypothetical protein